MSTARRMPLETGMEWKRSALAGRRRVTVALLVAMMVTAVEQLVVSPAMPTIIAHLKGFDIYPWVISAYSARLDRQHAHLWKAGRPIWPQACSDFWTYALQPGLDPVGHVARAWGS